MVSSELNRGTGEVEVLSLKEEVIFQSTSPTYFIVRLNSYSGVADPGVRGVSAD